MLKQPDWITKEMFLTVLQEVKKKKDLPLLEEVFFESMTEGLCVQMLHKGSFDDEPASFAKMAEFLAANQLQRTAYEHREIYLSDTRKTQPANRKTILRVTVAKMEE
ncbi:hypothetical protein M2139_001308 [Enterococcus sp. PF1-24]|nr:hypothetical protein [Enterococcus sp. PFB1-1]MDH6401424.1 hypothetical protein [Enterococcus sp. PF1-24]